jgi:hypothetical protein
MARRQIPDAGKATTKGTTKPTDEIRAPGRGGAGQWEASIHWGSLAEASRLLGPSTRTLNQWGHDGCDGIVHRGEGTEAKVNLGLLVKWMYARGEAAGAQNSAKIVKSMGGEDMDWEDVEAEIDVRIKELRFKNLNDELLDREKALQAISLQVGNMMSRFRAMGAKLGMFLATDKTAIACQRRIDKEVDEISRKIWADDGSGVDPEKLLEEELEEDPLDTENEAEVAPHRRRSQKAAPEPAAKPKPKAKPRAKPKPKA